MVLDQLDVDNQNAKLMVKLTRSQDYEIGLSTTTTATSVTSTQNGIKVAKINAAHESKLQVDATSVGENLVGDSAAVFDRDGRKEAARESDS
ncbi:unnamed protein product [Linum trigynum]|uniref:Uncharacterized protein n=1 Tax=Linum trigynum TaxID=586398 RepID=A0AAV2F965_9ROSI